MVLMQFNNVGKERTLQMYSFRINQKNILKIIL